MQTPDKIVAAPRCCADGTLPCHLVCEYEHDERCLVFPECREQMMADAAKLIEQFAEQVPKWVSVEERLPETTGKYIVCTTKRSVYCTKFKAYGTGGSFQTDINTHITYWMPLPEPPKEKDACE